MTVNPDLPAPPEPVVADEETVTRVFLAGLGTGAGTILASFTHSPHSFIIELVQNLLDSIEADPSARYELGRRAMQVAKGIPFNQVDDLTLPVKSAPWEQDGDNA